MSNLQPIPQTPISENHPWRDWLRAIGDYVNANPNGASGTFKSSDVPAKTVTVVNGIIISIK
jgi:hypothetical protein